jgi:hypothetical protein
MISKFEHASIAILGTIHLRRRQIFTIFYPYPTPSAVFYYYPSANLTNFLPLPPPPLQIADILNGWSLMFFWKN